MREEAPVTLAIDRVTAHLQSTDVIVARIYLLVPILGKAKTLVRVPLETADGWR